MLLKELEYIIAIAEEGSISRAADRLFMAQSSLSEFLKQYEAELGSRLFVRTSSGVRPTDSGRLLVEQARLIISQYKKVRNEISDIEDLKSGTLELGISTFRGTYMLPAVLRRFKLLYPGVSVNIHEENSFELEQMILDGKLDMALVALPVKKLTGNADFLLRDEICIVAHKSHPVLADAYRSPSEPERLFVNLRDTAKYEFVLSPRETILGDRGRRAFEKAGVFPVVYNDRINAFFAVAMAREGIGLAFTYRSCIQSVSSANILSIAPDGYYLDLALVYPEGYRSKAARALGKMFHEYFSSQSHVQNHHQHESSGEADGADVGVFPLR